MNKLELVTATFNDKEEQRSAVMRWKAVHNRLVEELGNIGSLVRLHQFREHDQDVPPYHFIRDGYHKFIFPKQRVMVESDNSRVIDPSTKYGIFLQDITYVYDPSQVEGHLRVAYDDSGNQVRFLVEDLMGDSRLDSKVLQILAATALTAGS